MNYDDEDHEEVPDAGPDSVTIGETVIRWDAQRMFDSIARTAAASLVKSMERDLRAEVASMVKDQINAQVGAKVAEVLDTHIQPANEWGEPKGAPTTLREMVGNAAREYLGTKVDKEGRPNTYNSTSTRIEHIVKQVVAKEFDYSMQQEVKKAVEMARNEAVAKVSSVVGDLIVKLGK